MDDSDIAWEDFKKGSQSFSKSSLIDKLDALSTQMHELQTTSSRLASVVPQLMGDSTALDMADSEPSQPPMADAPVDSDVVPNAESLGPAPAPSGAEGGDMTAEEDKTKDIEAGSEDHPVNETMPPAEDKGTPQLPVEDGVPANAPEPEAPLPPEGDVGDVGEPAPQAEMPAYEYNSDSAFQDLVDTIAEEIQEALGRGEFDKADALMDKIRALRSAWGADMPADLPPTGEDSVPMPPEAMAQAPVGTAPIMKNDGCTEEVIKDEGTMDDADVSADTDSVTANDSKDDDKEDSKEKDDKDEDEEDDDDEDEDDDEAFVKSEFSASAIFGDLCKNIYGVSQEQESVVKSEPVAEKVLEGFDDFVKSDRPPSFGAVGSNIAYTPSARPHDSFVKNDAGEELTLENITKRDWEALENHLIYKSQQTF